MPGFADAIKSEIKRLAKREVRKVYPDMKKELVELKRSNRELQRKVARLEKQASEFTTVARQTKIKQIPASEKELKQSRLSPGLIAKIRAKLKLSREDFGILAGVSPNTIYLWETGKINPNKESKAMLIGLRKLKIREAKKLLAEKGKVVKKPGRPKGKKKTKKTAAKKPAQKKAKPKKAAVAAK